MREILHVITASSIATASTEAALATAVDISGLGDGDSLIRWVAPCAGKVLDAGFIFTEVVATAADVFTVKIHPTPNSDTDERTVDAITAAVSGSTVGDVVHNASMPAASNADFFPGEEIELELTTDGTGTGAGYPYLIVELTIVGHQGQAGTTVKSAIGGSTQVGSIKNVLA